MLAGVGVASGFLSALFGVGGGVIVVPALVLLLRFDAKAATATSLAAIGITALAGTFSFSLFDHVHWDSAALVGLPALVGSIAGVQLQQRDLLDGAHPPVRALHRRVAVVLFLE